jgi:hypothetical protein
MFAQRPISGGRIAARESHNVTCALSYYIFVTVARDRGTLSLYMHRQL